MEWRLLVVEWNLCVIVKLFLSSRVKDVDQHCDERSRDQPQPPSIHDVREAAHQAPPFAELNKNTPNLTNPLDPHSSLI
jgi:hypothetical protein